jgi:hypothetical protein
VVLFIFISLICATSSALSVGGLHSCFLWVRASRESLGIGSTFSGVNDLGTTLTEAPLSLIRTPKTKKPQAYLRIFSPLTSGESDSHTKHDPNCAI